MKHEVEQVLTDQKKGSEWSSVPDFPRFRCMEGTTLWSRNAVTDASRRCCAAGAQFLQAWRRISRDDASVECAVSSLREASTSAWGNGQCAKNNTRQDRRLLPQPLPKAWNHLLELGTIFVGCDSVHNGDINRCKRKDYSHKRLLRCRAG
jgi:hypothetical protein